ncbi:WD40-repeat-containing domain protein [Phascolomyces articulosus]|uniref:WD40-repeat-containing domain protein n=1 Tax=Phascolomyces articulosus TaxID=60185 RepID=A0AAD5PD13_9FUNG|nr:WD40-repeat-containing domain protein [Phascolomyces articulosus]
MFAYPTPANRNYPFAHTKQTVSPIQLTSSSVNDDGTFVFTQYKTHKEVTTPIQHWQLRNLIRCSNGRTVIHPSDEALYMFNAKTNEDIPILTDLPFTPTTIDAGYGYVAMAGQRGMAMVKDTKSDWSARFSAGPGMNNSICLSKTINNEIRVVVCNNDQTVCILSVPQMEKKATLKMPAAINHTSVSPNGRMMLMVGDNGIVYLYKITESDDYQQIASYKASEEPALSCAWNPSSEKYAVTSQDGNVSVWDITQNARTEPICRIASTETRKTRKAPRCIQFSKGPLDLLAYSEHVSTVNIIDTRTFETRQVIRLAPNDMDYHITGLSFSSDNRSLFVGMEDSIVELNVDICSRRRFATGCIV